MVGCDRQSPRRSESASNYRHLPVLPKASWGFLFRGKFTGEDLMEDCAMGEILVGRERGGLDFGYLLAYVL